MNDDLKFKELTDAVICCFYNVYNVLGYGFLEKVYDNSLHYELTKRGISVTGQYPIPVYYDEQVVGEYFADLLVEKFTDH